MRSTRFGPGARQAFSAEGLHADHRADDVPVHIQVADRCTPPDVLRPGVQAGVHPHGETETGGVDLVDDAIEVLERESRHVEDRSETLAGQVADRTHLERHRRDKAPALRDVRLRNAF